MKKEDRILRQWKIVWTTIAVVLSIVAVIGAFYVFIDVSGLSIESGNILSVPEGKNVLTMLILVVMFSVMMSILILFVIWSAWDWIVNGGKE